MPGEAEFRSRNRLPGRTKRAASSATASVFDAVTAEITRSLAAHNACIDGWAVTPAVAAWPRSASWRGGIGELEVPGAGAFHAGLGFEPAAEYFADLAVADEADVSNVHSVSWLLPWNFCTRDDFAPAPDVAGQMFAQLCRRAALGHQVQLQQALLHVRQGQRRQHLAIEPRDHRCVASWQARPGRSRTTR